MSKEIDSPGGRDPPSHIFFFSHGWKGDVPAASDQYNRWIDAMLNLTADRDALRAPSSRSGSACTGPASRWATRRWAATLRRDRGRGVARGDDRDYLDRLGLGAEAEPLMRTIVDAPSEGRGRPRPAARRRARLPRAGGTGRSHLAGAAADRPTRTLHRSTRRSLSTPGTPSRGTDFAGGGLLGGILGPLRQLSYWTMKKRARSIGESGMHDFVAA